MKSTLLCFFLFFVITIHADSNYKLQFTAKSVKSDVFVPLRANKTQVLISECGKEVTDPFGILEQTYKEGSVKPAEKCTWKLRAPDGHVINIISISFILEDEISPSRSDDVKTSTISIYDGDKPNENLLTRYFVSPQEKVGQFISSASSKEDMVVEIEYHDNKDFATQRMLINYEFLNVHDMKALLRSLK